MAGLGISGIASVQVAYVGGACPVVAVQLVTGCCLVEAGVPYGSNPITCSVRAWRAWLEVSGISEGPAFHAVDRHGQIRRTRLGGQAVALVLKHHAARAGLDPGEVAGHSLRAGLATSAAAAGVPERVIAEQTGHKGTAVLRRYIREGSLFRENAASAVGL